MKINPHKLRRFIFNNLAVLIAGLILLPLNHLILKHFAYTYFAWFLILLTTSVVSFIVVVIVRLIQYHFE